MQDGKQLSTTSNQSVTIQTRESLRHCPVAQRLYDQTGDGVPLGVVAVVAASDMSIRSAADSVRGKEVTVKRFVKDFEERSLSAVILTHLMLAEDIANVSRPMKPEAMATVAKQVSRMLLDDDMTWNLADIRIVADRLGSGECGPVYGGLSGPMIMKAFTDYMCEKCDAFVALREEQAKEHSFGDFGAERGGTAHLKEKMKNLAALAAYNEGNFKKDIKQ